MSEALAIGGGVAVVVLAIALVLLVRAYTQVAPKLVAAAEREAEALKAKRAAELQRNEALSTAAVETSRANEALEKLARVEKVLADIRAKEPSRVADKIRSADSIDDALAALGELLSQGPRLPSVPGASGSAAEGDPETPPTVQPAAVADGAGDGRDPAG